MHKLSAPRLGQGYGQGATSFSDILCLGNYPAAGVAFVELNIYDRFELLKRGEELPVILMLLREVAFVFF